MDIPPRIFFAYTLKPGAVYYYASDGLLPCTVPHYHVVLSAADPERILLAVASTRIEQRRRFVELRHCPPDTLVLASPATEPYLTAQSAFNCNHPVVETMGSLTERYARLPIPAPGEASKELLQRLVAGVLRSPLVAKQYQDLLRKEWR